MQDRVTGQPGERPCADRARLKALGPPRRGIAARLKTLALGLMVLVGLPGRGVAAGLRTLTFTPGLALVLAVRLVLVLNLVLGLVGLVGRGVAAGLRTLTLALTPVLGLWLGLGLRVGLWLGLWLMLVVLGVLSVGGADLFGGGDDADVGCGARGGGVRVRV